MCLVFSDKCQTYEIILEKSRFRGQHLIRKYEGDCTVGKVIKVKLIALQAYGSLVSPSLVFIGILPWENNICLRLSIGPSKKYACLTGGIKL